MNFHGNNDFLALILQINVWKRKCKYHKSELIIQGQGIQNTKKLSFKR